ncbi:hypothetical protein [Planctopirus ephydatiae]|uniref:hypothetical protein n=1 Tax=Planctopirus ephydatiae TaxID=2528019 RepID=UPI0011A402A1|nr:hypothetical protein [Planctopirus ephydatiae]
MLTKQTQGKKDGVAAKSSQSGFWICRISVPSGIDSRSWRPECSTSLPGGYSISFTGTKILKQDGSAHHGVGIYPTVPAVPTRKGLAEGRDEVIEAALALVLARIAHSSIQAKP